MSMCIPWWTNHFYCTIGESGKDRNPPFWNTEAQLVAQAEQRKTEQEHEWEQGQEQRLEQGDV